jgi:3-phosphoshikimate 1-carboxyvinyltransferase
MTVIGRGALDATTHRLPVASAQLLAAASLAGLSAIGETVIESPGPTRDHTERMLAWTGVRIRREGRVTTLTGPATPRSFELSVPGDPSAASAWLVAGAVHPNAEIALDGVCINPTRLALVGLLRRMGADIEVHATDEAGPELVGAITVRSGRPLRAASVGDDEVAELIDELPLVAIAMASCAEESEVRNAGELRVKESDRIAAVVAGLDAIGANVTELPDGWRVRRGTPRAARIATHGDHRIAIAFAIAGMVGLATAVELDDPACTSVSYLGFWDDLAAVAQ